MSTLRKQFEYAMLVAMGGEQVASVYAKVVQNGLAQFIESNKIEDNADNYNLGDKDHMRVVADRFVKVFEYFRNKYSPTQSELLIKNMHVFTQIFGFFLSTNAFLKTIEMLGSPQQRQYWLAECMSGRVIGAYGQTELGHGSNVQNLQTQAHYNPTTKLFTIKSPKASSAKYWPGMLGIFATHTVLQAQTFIKGKNIGVQTFVIPIRNKNLETLPRVKVGDIGAKLGFEVYDNGYLLLDHFQVPRTAFLMRYIKIQDDGQIKGLENTQAIKYGYGSMLNLRVYLSGKFASNIIASTHCLANVFRANNTLETEQIQRYLIESYCVGYGISIANQQVHNLFKKFNETIRERKYNEADKYLSECHIVSATSKALTSWKFVNVSKSHLTMNRLCGLKSMTLANYFMLAVPAVTYEGDNSVLLQQTGRYILKLNFMRTVQQPKEMNMRSLSSLENIMEYVAQQQIIKLQKSYAQNLKTSTELTVWNQILQRQIIEVSKIWGTYILIRNFNKSISAIKEHKPFYERIGLLFSYSFLKDINRLTFYGLSSKGNFSPWKEFSFQQRQVLFNCLNSSKPISLTTDMLTIKGRRLEEIVRNHHSRL